MTDKTTPPSNLKNGDQETKNLEKYPVTPYQLINNPSTSRTQNPSAENISEAQDGYSEENTLFPNKKSTRKRCKVLKPYQKYPFNMARARIEVAMSLKHHRASWNQAHQITHSGPEHQQFGAASHQFSAEQEAMLKHMGSPRTCASNYHVNNINAYPPGLYSSPSYYSGPVSSLAPPLFIQGNPNFVLPNQTLALNLNHHQGSNLLDTSFISSTGNSSMLYNSSSSSSSNFCPPAISTAAEEITHMAGAPSAEIISGGDDQLNAEGVLDDLNFGVSAGQAEFLGATEIGADETQDFSFSSPFDGAMQFPAWVTADESCVADVCGGGGGDYFEDSALPCMDIEEIEEIDGDWLD